MLYGWGWIFCGFAMFYFILTGEIDAEGVSLFMCLLFWGLGWLALKWKKTVTVPNKEALDQKSVMEDKIETKKQEVVSKATAEFGNKFSVSDFLR